MTNNSKLEKLEAQLANLVLLGRRLEAQGGNADTQGRKATLERIDETKQAILKIMKPGRDRK